MKWTERTAVIAYLLDRAEQYSNSSGYRAFVDDLVNDIARGEHVFAAQHGEYDDLAKRAIFRRAALATAATKGEG